jgi:hypothetical protein
MKEGRPAKESRRCGHVKGTNRLLILFRWDLPFEQKYFNFPETWDLSGFYH